jgi:hypothetical protein
MRIVISSIAILAVMASTRSNAANCDLHDFLLNDISAINQSNESQLAFVLSPENSSGMRILRRL